MFIKLKASVLFFSALFCCGFTFAGEVEMMRMPANIAAPVGIAATEKIETTSVPSSRAGHETSTAIGKIELNSDADGTLSPSNRKSKKKGFANSVQNSAKMGANSKSYKPDTDGTGELKVKEGLNK